MRARRLATWPFAAFLFGYGLPTTDTTVVSIADTLLSSAALGVAFAVMVGLPLALIFRRSAGAFTRVTLIAMTVALVATVILDMGGFGLIGAALYLFWIRGPRAKERKAAPVPTSLD
jgi:hypothetical protein